MKTYIIQTRDGQYLLISANDVQDLRTKIDMSKVAYFCERS